MSPTPRRNDRCACGSGQRYKDCHGRLAPEALPQPPRIGALVESALTLHQRGRVEEAESLYRQILAREPGNPIATHYLGMATWHRGDRAAAETLMHAAIAADPSVPDFHNNLGLLLRDSGRIDAALESFRRALAVDASWIEAYSNIGLALESAYRLDEAIATYREAIAREPRFAVARQNLARALLARGAFAEGWEEYRWRLLAHGVSITPPDPHAPRFPARLDGRRIALCSEQGLGDVLFFLRFAPELQKRGARLAFRGDARLFPLLERTGLFALGMDALDVPRAECERVFVGDLPWLLEAYDPGAFPPPLPLSALPDRVERLRERLASWGPGPAMAVTWRAGTVAAGPVRTQSKSLGAAELAGQLRGLEATWVSIQRNPAPGEREDLTRALGAEVHDMSAANDDLEEMLALLVVIDDYVGVSNANVHLRAGLGRGCKVLVPFPPEWRWSGVGNRSPWFPSVEVRRQAPDGAWPSHRG